MSALFFNCELPRVTVTNSAAKFPRKLKLQQLRVLLLSLNLCTFSDSYFSLVHFKYLRLP